jgi:hypothetical protein
MHRFYLTGLLFFSLFIPGQSVQAQMYQWADPESGTTQLSGKPPAWYRSAEGGPRVFVFNRGKIVDDTGIEVSDEQRISLRTKAFVEAEQDRSAAQQKLLEVAKLKAAMERNSQKMPEEEMSEEDEPQLDLGDVMVMEEPDDAELIESDMSEEEQAIEKMMALIAEWEDKRTEEARAILQQEQGEK